MEDLNSLLEQLELAIENEDYGDGTLFYYCKK